MLPKLTTIDLVIPFTHARARPPYPPACATERRDARSREISKNTRVKFLLINYPKYNKQKTACG